MSVRSGYNKPSTIVKQEFVDDSVVLESPDMFTCLVGPAYQIETDVEGGTYLGSSVLIPFPDLITNAVVDEDSVIVKSTKDGVTDELELTTDYVISLSGGVPVGVQLVDDITIERTNQNNDSITGVLTNASTTFTDASARFVSIGLKPLDKIIVNGSGANAGEHIVASITSETEIELSVAASADQTNVSYSVTQMDHVGSGLGSSISITYVALRKDINTVKTIDSIETAKSVLGNIYDNRNILGFAAYIALMNTDKAFKIAATTGVTLSDFSVAAGLIEAEEVSYIVSLSSLDPIASMWESHVLTMSAPEEKKERSVWVSKKLSLRKVYASSSSATITAGASANFYNVNVVDSTFLSDGITPGDLMYVEIIDEYQAVSAIAHYIVHNVVDNDNIVVYSTDDITAITSVSFASEELSLQKQAELIRDFASSIEERRVRLVWPPVVNAMVNDEYVLVDGFNLAVALSAKASGYQPQKPLTKVNIAGFGDLKYSNLGYFNDGHLNTMGSGGVAIFVQKDYGTSPELRHQLTTDMTTVKTSEMSVTATADYVVKALRESLSETNGTENITNDYLDAVRMIIDSHLTAWKISDPDYGPLLVGSTIIYIKQSEIQEDKVQAKISIKIPIPGNYVELIVMV